jgi:hypothetical protein
MVLMAGYDLPTRAIREQIASALNLIVQIERARDGSRHISHLTEVVGMEGDIVTLQDIYRFDYDDEPAGADRRAPRIRRRTRAPGTSPSPPALRRPEVWSMMRSCVRRLLLARTGAHGALAHRARAQEPTDSLEVILAIDTSEACSRLDAAKIAANEFVSAMPRMCASVSRRSPTRSPC